MTSYRVVPNSGRWEVMTATSNSSKHRKVSQHMTKQNAKAKARRLAERVGHCKIGRGYSIQC
jgi:hypothetical protein